MDEPRTPDTGDAATAQVVVGVATYRRTEDLLALVPELARQAAAVSGAAARVVVVDNNPDGSARGPVQELGLSGVTCVAEPTPGIAAARNAAIAEAGDADAIVFIDDDEMPHEGWLQALVDAWLEWRCAIVAGRVIFLLPDGSDPWLQHTGLFESPTRPRGEVRLGASSANALYDLGALRRHGVGFDPRYGLTGGSDTMLAYSLRAAGEQVRWCPEAVVEETIPATRANREWAAARVRRTSNAWSRVQVDLAQTRGQRWRTLGGVAARGAVRLARGTVGGVRAKRSGDLAAHAHAAMDVASGRGLLESLAGQVRVEYQRPHS